jgi:precorrin-3B methylase
MATLVIVGSAQTRVVVRPGRTPLVYTPRIGEQPRSAGQEATA